MTTTINNALPPNNNTIELDQYYRLILGITLPDVNSLEYTAQYQKIYVDTLIGKYTQQIINNDFELITLI